jgi:esterase
VAPVTYDHRVFATYLRAMLDLDLGGITRRSEAEKRLEPADPDPRIRAFLASNLELEGGQARWLPNLEVLLRDLDAILTFPDELSARIFGSPTLFLSGARSDYILAEHEPLIRRLFPRVEILRLADAGHWVHADKPEAVIEALDRFLPKAA